MIVVLKHHRQASEILAARIGHHAIDHFLLQHEVHVIYQGRERNQMEQQRAGNVVGQVADNLQRPRTLERTKVEFERIAFVDGQPFRREALPKSRNQVAVDLDHLQMVDAFQQRAGDGTQPRSDFDQGVARTRGNRVHNLLDDAGRDKEVLPKPLPGSVPGHGFHPVCAVAAGTPS